VVPYTVAVPVEDDRIPRRVGQGRRLRRLETTVRGRGHTPIPCRSWVRQA
jgi:hypothetical protein